MSTPKIKPSNPAKITFKNIGHFIQGYKRMFSETFGLLDDHQKEQVIWRTIKAAECYKNGKCTYCGCDTPAKFYSDGACEDPVKQCYPEMMSRTEWEEFKLKNQIELPNDSSEQI